jgi:septal ring factor EnvC (AmiA/AmiB activator)
MFFDLFKKKEPPILKPEMLQPADAPISTADAKRILKEWMVKIGHLSNKDKLDKMELTDHVGYFVEEMKQHEESLKFDIDDEKESVAESIKEEKEEIRDLRKELAKCNDPAEKGNIEAQIADCERSIASYQESLAERVKALADFKADRRAFLVEYINTQVHGPEWRKKT